MENDSKMILVFLWMCTRLFPSRCTLIGPYGCDRLGSLRSRYEIFNNSWYVQTWSFAFLNTVKLLNHSRPFIIHMLEYVLLWIFFKLSYCKILSNFIEFHPSTNLWYSRCLFVLLKCSSICSSPDESSIIHYNIQLDSLLI